MNGRALNLLIVALALVLVAGLALKLRTRPQPAAAPAASPASASGAAATDAGPGRTLITEQGATVVLEGSLASEETQGAPTAEPVAPLNTLPPSQLALTDVKEYASENGLTVLVLRDGSKLLVNDFVYEQLPESIRFRLDYQRGEGR
ncbi:hypothetical protein [Oceanithermus desulfurans]|uniref:Uncharacterized protein n=2 Tax=Oceanithermus desulfurans TaxID=227924 RepID=A0A511RGD0_9DEIN|nr:hypothetical protein [Oceanithermus desulfurans]MBB6030152.1 hypothetical protein [Oceanithermus desulfurans]GEM88710.1 hypothetical protein ODE01S_01440 [Oceanithermus desulfurans NBRC 100063]